MNSENFHEYVKNPSMLHQVSYQELKSLVLQYPYSPNLRYLLLLKSLFDQSKDFDKNQVLASLTSPDRKRLRQLIKQYSRLKEMQENYTLNEDFLELKDLSVLEDLMKEPEVKEAVPPKGAGIAGAAVPPPPIVSTIEDLDEEIEAESDLSFLEGLFEGASGEATNIGEPELAAPAEPQPEIVSEEPMKVDTLLTLEDLMEQASETTVEMPTDETAAEEIIPEIEVEVAPENADEPKPHAADIPLEITNEADIQPAPMPRSSFNAWLRQLNPPQAGILQTDLKDISLNSKQLHHPEEEKETSAKQIAEQSVEEDKEIASETLALLLEKQKLYGKAISMYQRLQLLYPEKSSLFAAKIEELNKKI